ncbi:insulinase family protein [Dactylosporangium roseum]|uniref:Insulinase family protein n=2 Tax=Dactylosporangium roseum TaxID=47989 RepID=A0ABY5ZEP7_9ACTN|nr:insulinase family protein [Dactylosporangium roseum]
MIAGLTFRVGQVDETLSSRGITHLLEHLVLHGRGLTDYHYNGSTGAIATSFTTQGGEDDIVAFLDGVCAALHDPPLDRLETERSILRAEANGRSSGVNEMLPLWRYGARDYGLVSYGELGLPRLTPDDVRRWAETWFTRQNAVLWVAGNRLPEGLRLPLRNGVRRPVPAPSSALPATPAYFLGDEGAVVFDGIMRRSVTGGVLAGIVERELFRSLRQEDGNSYTASAFYDSRGDGFATVTAFADVAPGKPDAVLGGFIDVLARLKVGRIEQADLDAVRAKGEDALDGVTVAVGMLPGHALNLLTGQPVLSAEEIRTELRAVTLADVHAAFLEVYGTGLLQVPDGHSADWAGYVAAPTTSERAVDGRRFGDLVVGPEGVSLRHGERSATVVFKECAICLAFPDGGRQLIGHDSITVRIEPTLQSVPPDALRQIDAALAPVTVWLPARDPSAIPQAASPAGASSGQDKPTTGRVVGATVAFVLAVVVLCCGGVWTWVVADNSDPANDVAFDAVSGTINAVLYAAGLVLLGVGAWLLRGRSRKEVSRT